MDHVIDLNAASPPLFFTWTAIVLPPAPATTYGTSITSGATRCGPLGTPPPAPPLDADVGKPEPDDPFAVPEEEPPLPFAALPQASAETATPAIKK